jgi:hypothetical protein
VLQRPGAGLCCVLHGVPRWHDCTELGRTANCVRGGVEARRGASQVHASNARELHLLVQHPLRCVALFA